MSDFEAEARAIASQVGADMMGAITNAVIAQAANAIATALRAAQASGEANGIARAAQYHDRREKDYSADGVHHIAYWHREHAVGIRALSEPSKEGGANG